MFQHTAARRRLHSRFTRKNHAKRFNTQPHEGGCRRAVKLSWQPRKFQHTAARRRLQVQFNTNQIITNVSTHSRTKAAARGNQ